MIISVAIVQYLPAPRVLPYVLLLILFLGFGPELSALVYRSDTHLISGIGIVMPALSAAVSQVLLGRWTPWRAAALGSLSVPAVIAGFVVELLGVRETFEIFGSAIIFIALLVTAEA